VKLIFSSSGNRNLLGILIAIILIILDNSNVFLLWKTEAHKFPEAQKQIKDIIA
jgi:hypothetical protein